MPRSPSGASARPSPRVLIKSLERNALHTSRIRDMVRLNGNRSKIPSPELGVGYAATRVYYAPRRCDSCVADRGSRAAAGDASDWVPVSYTHLRAHETRHDLVCRLLLEKK